MLIFETQLQIDIPTPDILLEIIQNKNILSKRRSFISLRRSMRIGHNLQYLISGVYPN